MNKIGGAVFFAVNILSGGMRVKQSIHPNIINLLLWLHNRKMGFGKYSECDLERFEVP